MEVAVQINECFQFPSSVVNITTPILKAGFAYNAENEIVGTGLR